MGHLPLVEGKGGDCRAGETPRRFNEFLNPTLLAKQHQDRFSAELAGSLRQARPPVTAVWRDIGKLGSHRIRKVQFSRVGSALVDLVLAEKKPGVWSLLMKWHGEMPVPVISREGARQVLVLHKDFAGNVPTVSTWAWMWGPAGPIRLDVEGAVQEAIQKVAPGHTGYDTGGSGSRGTRLVVKRAVFSKRQR